MGTDIARPFNRSPRVARAVPKAPVTEAKLRVRVNAAVAVGLWVMLWAGYNTNLWYIEQPNFPDSAMNLVHGLRAFVPLLAAWLALLIMTARMGRLGEWILSPIGLLLFYAVVALASSALVSVEPGDAIYWGGMYFSIIAGLLAIVPVENPLPDLRQVMNFNWIVDSLLTLSLLGALPFLGRHAMTDVEGSPVSVRAYGTGYNDEGVLGMASTRNTGFARYAAIAGLVALARIWDGKPRKRLMWSVMLLASLYALVLSNGRTEVLAFIASASLVLFPMKRKRTVLILVGVGGAALLGVVGFYNKFFKYITRTGHMDTNMLTLSGRTHTWEEGWKLFVQSPWWGFGFQADRYYLHQHMHNAFLHVFVQAGVLGGGAILLALIAVWLLTLKHFFFRPPRDRVLIPPEIPGVLLFVTISSVTESTFAYYSAAWLLCAPIFAYVLALDRQQRKVQTIAARERYRSLLLKRRPRTAGPSSRANEAPSPPGQNLQHS